MIPISKSESVVHSIVAFMSQWGSIRYSFRYGVFGNQHILFHQFALRISSTSHPPKNCTDSDSISGFQELSSEVALQTETEVFTIPSDAQNGRTPDVLTTALSEIS